MAVDVEGDQYVLGESAVVVAIVAVAVGAGAASAGVGSTCCG